MGCLLTEFKLTAMQCGESSTAFGPLPFALHPPLAGFRSLSEYRLLFKMLERCHLVSVKYAQSQERK